MFRYGILSTASIIDRFIAGIRESQDSYVQAIASRNLETAKKALKHHKHVIVEKPFALTVLEAKELFTLAKKIFVF